MPQEPRDWAQWLQEHPHYRAQCYVAWKCGESTFRKFLDGDDETRRFIVSNLFFLQALFNSEEFRGSP